MVYFNESYDSAIEGYSCNMSYIGSTHFYRNGAFFAGGAIKSFYSSILFSGRVYIEGNVAKYNGGAIALLRASKLIFKPHLNIFFISNYATEKGGALYIKDSQCSLRSSVPIECFINIDGPHTSTNSISLHFENNSAGTTGSILYGGQLDQCRLYYFKSITAQQPDLCGYSYQAHSYNSDRALDAFMNMSKISQNEDHVLNVSSTAEKIIFCEDKIPNQLELYPGEQLFTIPVKALGQTKFPVPATVFWEKTYDPLYTTTW
jgi:predicted outer membrane repeat protein